MISLSKGQKVDLTKGNAVLRHLLIGLGWQSQGNNFDLDTAAFLLGANGKAAGDDDFIFYGTKSCGFNIEKAYFICVRRNHRQKLLVYGYR